MEVEINWGGKAAKKRFKLVRSDGPKDLVFQLLRRGAPLSDGNVLRRHLRPAAIKLGLDPTCQNCQLCPRGLQHSVK